MIMGERFLAAVPLPPYWLRRVGHAKRPATVGVLGQHQAAPANDGGVRVRHARQVRQRAKRKLKFQDPVGR